MSYSAPPRPLAGEEGLAPQEAVPRSRHFEPQTLALRCSLLASPNAFSKICLCSEL